jgi:anti-sigma B factor antagonist
VAVDTPGDRGRADPAADGPPGPSRDVTTTQPLTIETQLTAGTVTIVISGELDIATTPFLAEQLARILRSKPRRLVFDMTEVGFIDCAAVRLVVGAGQFLPDGRPSVIRPSPAVRRLLGLTGLDAHRKVHGEAE